MALEEHDYSAHDHPPASFGTVEKSSSYGFIVKGLRGEWLASFSLLDDALWFIGAHEQPDRGTKLQR